MKKILTTLLAIWLAYLVYLNFFYKGTKILCSMPLIMAAVLLFAFFAGIFWVGLPFSYILKRIFSKLFKLPPIKNQSLGMFFAVFGPMLIIFLLPFVFGMLLVFRAFPLLQRIIFASQYLFFEVQFLGLIYIYLGFSGKFNKYFLK